MDKQELWQAVLGELELNLSRANFTTWFKNTSISKRSGSEVTISIPNAFTKEWLENKYHNLILRALKNIDPRIKVVHYEVGSQEKRGPSPLQKTFHTIRRTFRKEKKFKSSGITLVNTNVYETDSETNLNHKYTFENFVVGSSNELARAACMAVAKNPGVTYNPLFIYGGVGLGKTHLLQAIGNETLESYPKRRVFYMTSEKFTNELIVSISNQKISEFKDKYRTIDVLIIDDIQFLAGKEKTQEEFFHTFNSLYGLNKQIVISSDRPPKAIPTLEERLRSRFEGGMIADIGQPDLETRIAILEAKCKERNKNIAPEVLNYIATHIQHNIRELEGALNRVIAHCELDDTEPDTKNTSQILAGIIPGPHMQKKAVSSKQIIQAISSYFNIKEEDLVGKSRRKEMVKPRQIAMFLIREEISASYPTIGDELGGRDHTTAIHACRKIESILKKDEGLRQEIDLIRGKIYQTPE